MTADRARSRAAVLASRERLVRVGAQRGLIGPGLAVLYVLATWDAGSRPTMVAVIAVMVAACLLTWWRAARIARSASRIPLQVSGILLNVAGSATLGVLDGGITSPLGVWVPLSLMFMALMLPPRMFAGVAAVSALAYVTVGLAGAPPRPGYTFTYVLGFGVLAHLCLRHAGALASLRRRLADVSRIDPLTRCLNRRGFDELLTQVLAEAERTRGSFTLVLADLDRFKEVNDTYGHRAGDELLAWTARALSGGLRPYDAVGRLGGDEFAVLLPDSGPEASGAVVRRLRVSLNGAVSASFGAATYPTDARTVEELKHVADQRVYRDKSSGTGRRSGVGAVPVAARPIEDSASATVSSLERRRQSIADMGWIAAVNDTIGLLYVALFATREAHAVPLTFLTALGLALGAAMVVSADRLARLRSPLAVMVPNAAVQYLIAVAIVSLDGGLSSPMALGLIAPMPLIALGTPLRLALPILLGASGCYVVVGISVGAPSGWYIVMHIVGVLAVCAVCAAQGRMAAYQRALLMRLTRVDVLTDCLNRRGFEERVDAALARARRTGRPVALLVLDLDAFKALNDREGHAAGDQLLCWVADTLRSHVRPHDVVGRLGGDEFVVLLSDSTAAEADTMAERLRARLAERTSVSIGAAASGEHGDDFDSLYAHADSALYEQKAQRGSRRRMPVRAFAQALVADRDAESPAGLEPPRSGLGTGRNDAGRPG